MKKEFCMKNVCGLIVALVAAMYAGGCCRCGGDHDMPKVEPVDVAKFELATPRTRARLFGEAKVWDFAAGVPSGGKVLKYAVCDAQGLHATAPTNREAAAGFRLDKRWTPQGAFLFEAEFVTGGLGASGTPRYEGVLWDDMAVTYVPKCTNKGFQLALETREGKWTPYLWLGFSNATERVAGPTIALEPGKPVSLSFYYNAIGNVVWEFAGISQESGLKSKGSLAPADSYRATLGDRATSHHRPLNGTLRRIAITPCKPESIALKMAGRSAFVRGEINAAVVVSVDNMAEEAIEDVRMRIEQFVETGRVRDTGRFVGDIPSGTSRDTVCPLEALPTSSPLSKALCFSSPSSTIMQ